MRKFEVVFRELANTRSFFRGKEANSHVKRLIGDSTNNNRTVTVNQTIRYFEEMRDFKFAKTIKIVYDLLEKDILSRRKNRTDAIDLSELVNSYRIVLMNGRSPTYRRRLTSLLTQNK